MLVLDIGPIIFSPLFSAVSCGHEEIVKLLLKCGADKSITDCEGSNPLNLCENDHIRSMLDS